jgi:hypothetical protein
MSLSNTSLMRVMAIERESSYLQMEKLIMNLKSSSSYKLIARVMESTKYFLLVLGVAAVNLW